MRRFMYGLILAIFSSCLWAQEADIQKAMDRYKNMNTLTANVMRTKHNAAVTKDVMTKGMFYFKKPSKMCMMFDEGNDKLLMDGSTFTMVTNGKKSTANVGGSSQFESLQAVFKGLTSGGESDVNINDVAEFDMEKQGNTLVLIITPVVADEKARRKMPFSSFVLTIDTASSELRSLRMNEKGENYTQYDFSGFVFDAPVDDLFFNP